MRVSRLLLVTLRETPADAEIPSHQLLLRGGYIRRVSAGIYVYLPLMWRVIKKVMKIVQQEMDLVGGLETLLPQLQPSELWKKSGRWEGYTQGEGIMFNLKDRQKRSLGLGPTHEEVVTSVVDELINSYRQLPITIYQTQTKFRDEIRPRFGLMRGREFIMKDAYSFHTNESCLQDTYKKMDAAYKKIFARCGLKVIPVEADSGAIGGEASQEFMLTADSGEDCILISPDGKYAANQEKAVSIPSDPLPIKEEQSSIQTTICSGSIEDLCKTSQLDSSQIIKVILMLATIEEGKFQPILISLRGDQELNEVKLFNEVTKLINKNVLEISPITSEGVASQGLPPFPFGSIGPDLEDTYLKGAKNWSNNFMRLADHTAIKLKTFICGANELNKHKFNTNWKEISKTPSPLDIRKAKPGERCVHDPLQTLQEARGIEVGHIFQLGTKYSNALRATFTDEEGTLKPFWMGCYGIGISRLSQAAVEQNNDDLGIIWPLAIAPYHVIIVIANMQDILQKELGEMLYLKLQESKIEVLLDDRDERAGVKFKDADLIGIPLRIVVGRDAKEGKVEFLIRHSKQSKLVSSHEALNEVITHVQSISNA